MMVNCPDMCRIKKLGMKGTGEVSSPCVFFSHFISSFYFKFIWSLGRGDHLGIYGHQGKSECKEINVQDNYRKKIIISQINSISYTDISIMPLCLHPQIKLSSLSCDTVSSDKFGTRML